MKKAEFWLVVGLITYILHICSCRPISKIGHNNFEGFTNAGLSFRDYSGLGDDFEELNGLLLKLDTIKRHGLVSDTIHNFPMTLTKFEGLVGMRVGKWGVSGRGVPEVFEAECAFEFYVYSNNTEDLFKTMADSAYQRMSNNKNFYNPRQSPLSFEVFQKDSLNAIIRIFAPLQKPGYYEIFLVDKYVKIKMPEKHPEAKRYGRWIQHYIYYELTRGLRLKDGETQMSFESKTLLSDSSFIAQHEKGFIR